MSSLFLTKLLSYQSILLLLLDDYEIVDVQQSWG